jgi:hypothetical protein
MTSELRSSAPMTGARGIRQVRDLRALDDTRGRRVVGQPANDVSSWISAPRARRPGGGVFTVQMGRRAPEESIDIDTIDGKWNVTPRHAPSARCRSFARGGDSRAGSDDRAATGCRCRSCARQRLSFEHDRLEARVDQPRPPRPRRTAPTMTSTERIRLQPFRQRNIIRQFGEMDDRHPAARSSALRSSPRPRRRRAKCGPAISSAVDRHPRTPASRCAGPDSR